MEKTRHRCINILFMIIIGTWIAGSAIPANAADPIAQQGLVDKARITFQSFMADPIHPGQRLLVAPSK